MKDAEVRRSPAGTDWTFIRSYPTPSDVDVVSIRSDAGATRYLDRDEWDDWKVIG